MCVAACNREKFTKTPCCCISRSFKVIDVGTTGKAVSKSVSACNRSHSRLVDSSRNRAF